MIVDPQRHDGREGESDQRCSPDVNLFGWGDPVDFGRGGGPERLAGLWIDGGRIGIVVGAVVPDQAGGCGK